MKFAFRFLLRWTLVTTLAWAISIAVLFYRLTAGNINDLDFEASGSLAFVGGIVGMALLIGLAQSWALRDLLPRPISWLLVTSGGALLGMLAAEVAVRNGWIATRNWLSAVAFIFLPITVLQYFVLMRHVRIGCATTLVWAFVRLGGLSLAFSVGYVPGALIALPVVAVLGDEAWLWALVTTIGFVFAVITGLGPLVLLRESQRHPDVPAPITAI